jgi:raffinose/stachyose/melibiose transport system permease protein
MASHTVTTPRPSSNRAPARSREHITQRFVIGLFLLPAMALIVVFLMYPIAQSVRLSFFRWDGVNPIQTFVGWGNWDRLVSDEIFWRALRNNILLIVASIAIQMPIAMALAVVLDRASRRLARILRVLYFLPLLLSTVAVGVLFRNVYDRSFGLLNAFLELIGLERFTQAWLGNPDTALPAVIAVVIWQFVPFYMILFAAGLADLPADLRDAARVDGATERQYFFRIALPQLRPLVNVAIVLSLIGALKYFDVVWVMTGGGPVHATELMATYMFSKAFRTNEVGYGATIAAALFLTVLLASLASTAWAARRRRLEANR